MDYLDKEEATAVYKPAMMAMKEEEEDVKFVQKCEEYDKLRIKVVPPNPLVTSHIYKIEATRYFYPNEPGHLSSLLLAHLAGKCN